MTETKIVPPSAAARAPAQLRVTAGMFYEINANHVSIYGYRTSHAWEDILKPDYFLPMWTRFAATQTGTKARLWTPDTIKVSRLVQPGGPGTAHYWEIADLIITRADEKSVTVELLANPRLVGAPAGVKVSYPPEAVKKAA